MRSLRWSRWIRGGRDMSGADYVHRAGRRELPSLPMPGESPRDAYARRARDLDGKWSSRPDPQSLPPGSESAQDAYRRFLRDRLAPSLRRLDLKGSGRNFRFDRGDFRCVFSFQGSKYNDKAIVEFTVNTAVQHAPTSRAFWGDRIGFLLPDMTDTWWMLPAGADTDELLSDLVESFAEYALVAAQAAMEEYDSWADPTRQWARRFDDPIKRRDRTGPRNLFPAPLGLDEGFAKLYDPDFAERALALSILYRWVPDHPRLVPELLRFIEHEPRSYTRSVAARYLGFVRSDPSLTLPALDAVVSEDEELEVRISARYARHLIARQQGRSSPS
ncbi:MAG TPA: DUF4304 domain-containing protein [Acidimicrobiales bacterium]|nr:DUF4304 domain-containing protein [Acidimicrobiales bacterium]